MSKLRINELGNKGERSCREAGAKQKPGSVFDLFKAKAEQKERVSIPQKLAEANALVKTEEWVKDIDVSKVLENNDSGNFKIIRDDKHGNPKVVLTTQTEKGDKVEFILEITSDQYGRKVSEILEDLEVVPEELIGRVQLIEDAHRVSVLVNNPSLVEKTIGLMLDREGRRDRVCHVSDREVHMAVRLERFSSCLKPALDPATVRIGYVPYEELPAATHEIRMPEVYGTNLVMPEPEIKS